MMAGTTRRHTLDAAMQRIPEAKLTDGAAQAAAYAAGLEHLTIISPGDRHLAVHGRMPG